MSLPKLLLLHGALGAASQFSVLKEILSDDFEILTMDFPGHGGREIPLTQFSFPLFVSDVLEFLDKIKIDSIDIFGYSMGGYAAMWLAKYNPARVKNIFTLATKMDWSEEIAQREVSMLNPQKVEEKIPAFAKMLEARHAPEDWKVVMQKTAGMMIELGASHLTKKDFSVIKHKTMIGIGDKDNMVSISESEKVSKLLPNGSLKVFNDMQHPFEKVELNKLVPEIKSFFK